MSAGTTIPRHGSQAAKSRTRRWCLREEMLDQGSLKVDRESGLIKNIKILGYESKNGRLYTPDAMKAAIGLYEGVLVNIDHPHVLGKEKPEAPRSSYDRFGKLINVRYVSGQGLYGDLKYLTTHPMAERICEAAESMPELFGLSHNAEGDTEHGIFVVKKIVEVRHVDVVADAATNKSLAESYNPMSWEKELLERAEQSEKLSAKNKKILREMLTEGSNGSDADDTDDHRSHVLRAVHSLLTNEEDDDRYGKINSLMKVINPKPEEEEDDDDLKKEKDVIAEEDDEHAGHVGEEEGGDGGSEAPSDTAPGLRKGPDAMPNAKEKMFRKTPGDPLEEQVRVLKLEKEVRRLCEAAGVPATETLIEAMAATKDQKKIKTCIEDLKKSNRVGRLPMSPRSQSPGARNTNRLDRESFIRELKNGR